MGRFQADVVKPLLGEKPFDAARSAAGLPEMAYTDPGLAAGTAVKGAHIQELRTGVR